MRNVTAWMGLAGLVPALLAMCLCLSASSSAQPVTAPANVTKAAQAAPSPAPRQVIVGAYINDIQELDFKSNSYAIDLYVWFRWKGSEIDPTKSMEFMNRYSPNDDVRTQIYDKPKLMPDGSFYQILRNQGRFSTKFQLERYPFDRQALVVEMEDSVSSADEQVYLSDPGRGVTIDPQITLPGFTVGKPTMTIAANPYPTDFGDLSEPTATPYSRVTIAIPVMRPMVAMSIKTFVPIGLILVCAALVFFVKPEYVEGRIGLGITALLTLVAVQLSAGATLPDVDYLMMIDKVYLLAYVFIIVALTRVVMTSWGGGHHESEATIARRDRIWVAGLTSLYIAANIAVAWTTLRGL